MARKLKAEQLLMRADSLLKEAKERVTIMRPGALRAIQRARLATNEAIAELGTIQLEKS